MKLILLFILPVQFAENLIGFFMRLEFLSPPLLDVVGVSLEKRPKSEIQIRHSLAVIPSSAWRLSSFD